MDEKTGLVLEGGGMRGMYTAGVLDVFMKENINFQGVIGVSAGAVHGGSYMSQQLGRNVKYNLKYVRDKRYGSLKSLIKTGNYFNVEFCYETIPNQLNKLDYDQFEKNARDIPFYVVCSNVETGNPEYIRCKDLREDVDYLRASASLPIMSKIVEVDGKLLLDGGSTDSIPVAFMRNNGYKKNVVVLTRPEGYVKKPDKSIRVIERLYSQYPEYVEACRKRHEEYNRTLMYIDYLEKEGQTLVIRPSREIKIKRLEKNIDKLKYVYKLGRYDTLKKLDEIKSFLTN